MKNVEITVDGINYKILKQEEGVIVEKLSRDKALSTLFVPFWLLDFLQSIEISKEK